MYNNPHFSRINKSRHHNVRIILIALIVLLLLLLMMPSLPFVTNADYGAATSDTTKEFVDALDADELNALLDALNEKALTIFGGNDYISAVESIVSGNFSLDYSNIVTYLFSLFGTSIERVMWLLVTILAVGVLYAVIGGIKSKFSATTISKAVHIASMISIIAVVTTVTYSMLSSCREYIEALNTQMSVVFPIVFSIMAAVGASSTVSVYQPAVAVMSSGVMELITAFLIPALIFAFVFMTVSSVSGELKLKKMSDFLLSAVKWMLGIVFFLMCAFMSVQGITASVYDSVSIRTAKFTMSKYLPVIGSYLSEGLNLILSGGVIVKNAIGYTAIVILVLSVLPLVVQLIVYMLTLKLSAAVVEPLGNETMSKYLTSVSNMMGVLIALVLGATFVYFVFLLLIIMTGNIAL